MTAQREIIAALTSPAARTQPVEDVELIQTHASYVLLAGNDAYKIKKPLDLGFLDYSTLEKRRRMCEEEVRLNRRLCEGVYLAVVPITRTASGYRVGGEGEAVEYAVHMRRVPRERMLDAMLEHGAATAAIVRRVAREIASFHERSETDAHVATFGRIETLRANWAENFEQTAAFAHGVLPREQLDAVRGYVERFLGEQQALIDERADAGRVRDCHGDLRADAVYVREDGEICVMDCVEFNDRIRYGDVAGDIGFLAMDLEHRGHGELADELMGAYLSGGGDETLPLVLRYYKTYRAFVRGKVEAMRSVEEEVPQGARRAAADAARRYFALAARYAGESYPQWLVYMVGLSGTGKSYLADALACRIGAVVLRTDVLRGQARASAGGTGFGEGRYAAQARERVYERMREAARRHLTLGRSVILDATHLARADREAARALARDAGVPALAIEVRADDELVRERLGRRAEEGESASEATWEIYVEQKRRMEALEDAERPRVGVDTSQVVTAQIEQVLAELP